MRPALPTDHRPFITRPSRNSRSLPLAFSRAMSGDGLPVESTIKLELSTLTSCTSTLVTAIGSPAAVMNGPPASVRSHDPPRHRYSIVFASVKLRDTDRVVF